MLARPVGMTICGLLFTYIMLLFEKHSDGFVCDLKRNNTCKFASASFKPTKYWLLQFIYLQFAYI